MGFGFKTTATGTVPMGGKKGLERVGAARGLGYSRKITAGVAGRMQADVKLSGSGGEPEGSSGAPIIGGAHLACALVRDVMFAGEHQVRPGERAPSLT